MKLHNTLTGTTDTLKPLKKNKIKMYTCGLTVYSQPHIGNWLGYIYWDVLIRTLKSEGYEVERTQNITDVGHLVSDDDDGEDKMEKGARTEGTTAWKIAKKYSAIAEHEAFDLLGLIRPDHLVPATSCIDKQILFTKVLDEKGYLYRTNDGMYFDTSNLTNYGALARLDKEGLRAGARIESADKQNPTDFAVWKFSPKDTKRDMEWDSPWGKGFPGWHLECSVIARETLGDQIDIHTGGIDHIPVHHTNEIAQTESVTGKKFSSFWIHNNHIKVDGTKISKSLGNVYTLEDVVNKGFSVDAFKLMVLAKHYRTEGNFTWEILEAAQNRLNRWKSIAVMRWQVDDALTVKEKLLLTSKKTIMDALTNDLDTPRALAAIDSILDTLNIDSPTDVSPHTIHQLFSFVDQLLGLKIIDTTPNITEENNGLVLARSEARQQKNWSKSDEIRNKLEKRGIMLRDVQDCSWWFYK